MTSVNEAGSSASSTSARSKDADHHFVNSVAFYLSQGQRSPSAADPESIPLPSVFGKFQMLEIIGRGGMGIVFRAKQQDIGRTVAIKLMRNFGEDPTKIEQLIRSEAELAAKIQHPSIVTIYECGVETEIPWVSMQLVDGMNMQTYLSKHSISTKEAVRCISEVSQAVEQLHESEIIHRDIKPPNILRSEKGDYFLSDFGIAKPSPSQRTSAEDSKGFAGTVLYASPEQTGGAQDVTEASDIYSLGATLYHLLTGRAPFRASNFEQTVALIQSEDPISPSELNRDIPSDLEAICLKCLAKSPADRYSSLQMLSADLENWKSGRPTNARPVGGFERIAKWARREPVVSVLLASCVLLLTVIAATSALAHQSAVLNSQQLEESFAQQRISLGLSNELSTNILSYLNGQIIEPTEQKGMRAQFGEYLSNWVQRVEDSDLQGYETKSSANLKVALGDLFIRAGDERLGVQMLDDAKATLEGVDTNDARTNLAFVKLTMYEANKLVDGDEPEQSIELFEKAEQCLDSAGVSENEALDLRTQIRYAKAFAFKKAGQFDDAYAASQLIDWSDEDWSHVQPRTVLNAGIAKGKILHDQLLFGDLPNADGIAALEKNVEYWRKAKETFPEYVSIQFHAGSSMIPYATFLGSTPEKSLAVRRECVNQLYSLAFQNRQWKEARGQLFTATSQAMYGELKLKGGDLSKAESFYEMVLPLAMEMEEESVNDPRLASGYGQMLRQGALLESKRKNPDKALETIRKSVALLSKVVADELGIDINVEQARKNYAGALYDNATMETDADESERLAFEAAAWLNKTTSGHFIQERVNVAMLFQKLSVRHKEQNPKRALELLNMMPEVTQFQVFQAIDVVVRWHLNRDEFEDASKLLDKCDIQRFPEMAGYVKKTRAAIQSQQPND